MVLDLRLSHSVSMPCDYFQQLFCVMSQGECAVLGELSPLARSQGGLDSMLKNNLWADYEKQSIKKYDKYHEFSSAEFLSNLLIH